MAEEEGKVSNSDGTVAVAGLRIKGMNKEENAVRHVDGAESPESRKRRMARERQARHRAKIRAAESPESRKRRLARERQARYRSRLRALHSQQANSDGELCAESPESRKRRLAQERLSRYQAKLRADLASQQANSVRDCSPGQQSAGMGEEKQTSNLDVAESPQSRKRRLGRERQARYRAKIRAKLISQLENSLDDNTSRHGSAGMEEKQQIGDLDGVESPESRKRRLARERQARHRAKIRANPSSQKQGENYPRTP